MTAALAGRPPPPTEFVVEWQLVDDATAAPLPSGGREGREVVLDLRSGNRDGPASPSHGAAASSSRSLALPLGSPV